MKKIGFFEITRKGEGEEISRFYVREKDTEEKGKRVVCVFMHQDDRNIAF